MLVSTEMRLAAAFVSLAMLSGGGGIVSIVNASRMKADLAHFKPTLLPAIVAINQIQDTTSDRIQTAASGTQHVTGRRIAY